MRKLRLEEAKTKEVDGDENEVHKSTTIFHGVKTDYGTGKGYIEPPQYLR